MARFPLCRHCRCRTVILALAALLLIITCSLLVPITQKTQVDITLESFNQLANKENFLHHADDMQRLQKSIINELGQLEQRRNSLKSSVDLLETNQRNADSQLKGMERSMMQLKADVHNMLLTQAETLHDYSSVPLPLKLLPKESGKNYKLPKTACQLHTCFDYSRCSVLSGFPIYLYPLSTDDNILLYWKSALIESRHITNDPDTACMFILLYDGTDSDFRSLPFWRGDGRNHLIINVVAKTLTPQLSRAMLAQMEFNSSQPVEGFDVPLPYMNLQPLDHNYLPLLLPVRRKNLVSFYGSTPKNSNEAERGFIDALSNLQSSSLTLTAAITVRCASDANCPANQWCLCNDSRLVNVEKVSTFVVIPNVENISYEQFTYRIYMALVNGAVPVVLGFHHQLPLAEIINWQSAVISLPLQRVPELVYIIRNVLEPDIFSYKKQGRFILENYLISIHKLANSLIDLLRTRINIPPLSAPVPESSPIYNHKNPKITFEVRVDANSELLGPIEDPFPSAPYQRNFTSWIRNSEATQQSLSTNIFPHTPWDPILPTDAKYHGSSYGFRPINGGAGGSGKEFAESLGGNHPREQFTIVILTYDRTELLQQQLAQLNGLPYLNKVLVIWNNPQNPSPALQWPRIHVNIEVIKAEKNSLNNRFQPYEEIETEGVLSIDDDMYLRHDEIIFAFRVWREARDRIVGFPGRYHAWNLQDQSWNYNANHSCELSMILTGAAFFHKYYMYQYSYFMPQAIRDKVDEFMNCEDLAMNFLVSHITGKPPIKTTSRWTFRCPTCGEASLWIDESHFSERHQCIQFFTQVYGYLPLLYTQFRADSVLFKTRVPQDKTKCFTLV